MGERKRGRRYGFGKCGKCGVTLPGVYLRIGEKEYCMKCYRIEARKLERKE